MNDILQLTPNGLYCRKGDFYIDPWRPVNKAVITHAHADHARWGSKSYLCAAPGLALLRTRLGGDARIDTVQYGQVININSVGLSLHPAGHILGSSQVKLTQQGHVCVVSGDYKTAYDPTCASLEPLNCHTFISEATFGLPVFKWPSSQTVFGEIETWWRENRQQERTSILFAYALGKAQRILAGLKAPIGPILTHGAVEKITQCYRETGIALPETIPISALKDRGQLGGALVIAPPSADNPAWMRKFPNRSRAFASGWMHIRGNRRRRSVDRGFVLSDHSGWDGLVQTIRASGAEQIGVTHGYAPEMARWLNENGYQATVIPTVYPGEQASQGDEA